MLLYEHDRTEVLVSRLVTIARMVYGIILLLFIVGLGILGALIAMMFAAGNVGAGAVIGFIIGAIPGYLIGQFVASLATVTVEWMAQVLVAQGEIVAATKQKQP